MLEKGLQHESEIIDGAIIQRVAGPRPIDDPRNPSGVLQHLEVLGDGGLRHGQGLDQLATHTGIFARQ